MPPEANIQSVMRQRLSSMEMQCLHSCDEGSAGFDERISLAATACARCSLAESGKRVACARRASA